MNDQADTSVPLSAEEEKQVREWVAEDERRGVQNAMKSRSLGDPRGSLTVERLLATLDAVRDSLDVDYRKREPIARASYSLPPALAHWARETAKREGVPISRVIEVALRRYRSAEYAAQQDREKR